MVQSDEDTSISGHDTPDGVKTSPTYGDADRIVPTVSESGNSSYGGAETEYEGTDSSNEEGIGTAYGSSDSSSEEGTETANSGTDSSSGGSNSSQEKVKSPNGNGAQITPPSSTSTQAEPAVATQSAGRSAVGKIWKMPRLSEPSAELLECAGGSVLLAKLLMARGFADASDADLYLNAENHTATGPMELPDVDKCLVRINQAIAQGEHITVYGDYDVDGVTGTSVLYTVLRRLGASVNFYIPNRASEGYGLNLKAVSILASKHRTKLIITCDCGVSNFAEINFAKSLGVETLVLDHHTMPEMLPPAVAIVHPKRLDESHPLFHLPGVGVAYKVCEALLLDKGFGAEVPALLDFVTLGMIADMVPLIRENRYLVKIGLPYLAKSPRPGIKALLGQIGKFEDTDLVGFGLAPRINAVGRLSDANAAVELMTTESAEVAETLARQLQTENERRQELCEQIFFEADRRVSTAVDLTNDRAIAIFSKGWHHGVVGIVASRLVEKYNRPVFIGELDENDSVVKGSARSVDGIDLYEVLKANEHLLTRWGGHKMAAGFAMEADRAEAACRAIVETCNRKLGDKPSQPILEIDLVAEPGEVNLDLVRLIARMAPFGMWNKKPMFCLQNVTCSASRPLGKEGKHSRIMVLDASQALAFECVMWNSRGRVPLEQTLIDLAFTAEINSYNGRDRLQLVLSDWRIANGVAGDGSVEDGTAYDGAAESSKDLVTAGAARKQLRPGSLEAACRPAETGVPGESALNTVASQKRELELNKIAEKARTQKDLLTVAPAVSAVRMQNLVSVKYVWKDLREHAQPFQIVQRAVEKLGTEVAVFGESCKLIEAVKFTDRTLIQAKQHVIFWQMPPSVKIFQEILSRNPQCNIYLLGADHSDCDEPAAFLKRLFGVIRFAVNKKDGQVEGEKLAAALGASKMSVALGLTILRRVGLIDWFSEDGCIFLDLLGSADKEAEELAEYKQLISSLNATKEFREWCVTGRLDDIQLAVTPNHVAGSAEINAPAADDE